MIAAGIVGALGNELVPQYRIRVGHSIGSEALITEGRHARTNALTSLAVVVAESERYSAKRGSTR